MITEKTKYLSDYYGHEKQSRCFYRKERMHLRKEFVIEYCDDEEKLNRLGVLPEYGGLELDDVYHAIHFKEDETKTDTFEGIAMQTFLYMSFNPKICDVKMWENIYDGDELIEERFIDMPCTFYSSFAKQIAKDVKENRDALRKANDILVKENEMMQAFIKKFHAEDVYKEFRDENRMGWDNP